MDTTSERWQRCFGCLEAIQADQPCCASEPQEQSVTCQYSSRDGWTKRHQLCIFILFVWVDHGFFLLVRIMRVINWQRFFDTGVSFYFVLLIFYFLVWVDVIFLSQLWLSINNHLSYCFWCLWLSVVFIVWQLLHGLSVISIFVTYIQTLVGRVVNSYHESYYFNQSLCCHVIFFYLTNFVLFESLNPSNFNVEHESSTDSQHGGEYCLRS